MKIQNTKVRETLLGLIFEGNEEGIGELPEFRLLERRSSFEDSRNRYSCYQYVFELDNMTPWRQDDLSFSEWRKVQEKYTEVKNFKKGDILVYSLLDIPYHVAIAIDDYYARSKFGYGNIYKHPILAVPHHYGDILNGFRI